MKAFLCKRSQSIVGIFGATSSLLRVLGTQFYLSKPVWQIAIHLAVGSQERLCSPLPFLPFHPRCRCSERRVILRDSAQIAWTGTQKYVDRFKFCIQTSDLMAINWWEVFLFDFLPWWCPSKETILGRSPSQDMFFLCKSNRLLSE